MSDNQPNEGRASDQLALNGETSGDTRAPILPGPSMPPPIIEELSPIASTPPPVASAPPPTISTPLPVTSAPPPADWRELKRQERERRRAARRKGNGDNGWIAGVVLIGIGALLLLQNMGMLNLHNWWALFILIPALGSFGTAWSFYSRSGELSPAVTGPFIGGLLLTGVASAFLFDWSWGIVGPGLLIILGVSALVSQPLWRH
ncbi:MAG: hypothetical protein WCF84_01305, partial [Anaerolineae bacterium]